MHNWAKNSRNGTKNSLSSWTLKIKLKHDTSRKKQFSKKGYRHANLILMNWRLDYPAWVSDKSFYLKLFVLIMVSIWTHPMLNSATPDENRIRVQIWDEMETQFRSQIQNKDAEIDKFRELYYALQVDSPFHTNMLYVHIMTCSFCSVNTDP